MILPGFSGFVAPEQAVAPRAVPRLMAREKTDVLVDLSRVVLERQLAPEHQRERTSECGGGLGAIEEIPGGVKEAMIVRWFVSPAHRVGGQSRQTVRKGALEVGADPFTGRPLLRPDELNAPVKRQLGATVEDLLFRGWCSVRPLSTRLRGQDRRLELSAGKLLSSVSLLATRARQHRAAAAYTRFLSGPYWAVNGIRDSPIGFGRGARLFGAPDG